MNWNGPFTRIACTASVVACAAAAAAAQASSIGKRYPREADSAEHDPRLEPYKGNKLLEQTSLIGVKIEPPRRFRVGDLLTVVVREQRTFEADSDLKTRNKFDVTSELDAFIKATEGGIGAALFRRGKPNLEYGFSMQRRDEADTSREDRFTTRLTSRIVDVKPNGTLIIEAVQNVRFDEEASTVTLTGECRSEDVTPDNTVLSTQIARLDVQVDNAGAVRDGSKRGAIGRIFDFLKPL